VLATADHIDKFWDPRMKRAIFADDGTGLLADRARGDRAPRRRRAPGSQTRATEFNTAHEIGHSDAG
jgi:formate dehydrogenase subunit delta